MSNPTNLDKRGLKTIKTARDEEAINEAARIGFFPLVKKVEPSAEIRSKYAVLQNKKTGEIDVIGDYRAYEYSLPDLAKSNGIDDHEAENDYETVIDFTFYYPNSFASPFAAYLIPKDIKVGERVYLEDLIEDYIGASWNQGDTYRLEGCEAIWNGKDFDIQYDPGINREDFLG